MAIDMKMNPTSYPPGIAGGFVRDPVTNSTAKASANQNKLAEKPTAGVNVNKLTEKPTAGVNDKLAKANNVKNEDKNQSSTRVSDVVDKAVTSLNSSIQSIQRNLQFSVDKDLGKIVINVTDKETDKVVRQIPSESVLELARNLQDLADSRNNSSKSSNEGAFFSSTA